MNRKEAIQTLKELRRYAVGRDWACDVEALTAGIQALEAQEGAQQPIPLNIATRMKALDSLLSSLELSESAASLMRALLEALDAGVVVSGATVAGSLTVALLADRLSWAEHYYYDSDCPYYWLYKKLLLTVIPAICPELWESEEGAETDDENI